MFWEKKVDCSQILEPKCLLQIEVPRTSWHARLCSGFGTMYGNIMVKKNKLIEINLGFWNIVRKYKGKKTF